MHWIVPISSAEIFDFYQWYALFHDVLRYKSFVSDGFIIPSKLCFYKTKVLPLGVWIDKITKKCFVG
jgi:hypothetical protein